MDDERLAFIVDWYEDMAARTRQFQFFFFVNSQSVEMYDIKNRRKFLGTSVKEQNLTLADLYIGSNINIYGRKLTVVDYGDDYTRRRLCAKKERTLGIIRPDAIDKLGSILDRIYQRGFLITQLRMCQMTRDQAGVLYEEHCSKPFFTTLLDYVCSGPVVAFEIVGENAVSAWREAIGPTDPSDARKSSPTSIRAQFGTDKMYNAVHGSETAASAAREVEFFFPSSGVGVKNTARVDNCSCCIIKPSAVKAGIAGKIITAITEANFKVGAAQMLLLEKANAEEFLEVYKGVVQEYPGLVTELTSGPLIALEIVGNDSAPNVATAFRELCGPSDPEIARHLRPRTLRSIFGTDKVKNAVHCTDLPDDGQLEVEYFFRILDR